MKAKPTIDPELIDRLIQGRDPATLLGAGGVVGEVEAAIAQRILKAEITHHMGTPGQRDAGNVRNGYSKKTVLTGNGHIELDIPRDRAGEFEPRIIPKHQRRLPDFDRLVVALFTQGMTVRDIQARLAKLYDIDVSPSLISEVTEAVMDEAKAWQQRPLEETCAIVFLDAVRVKIRDEGCVSNHAVHLAIGVRPDGTREILGLWVAHDEGAKFWARVLNDLRNRGVRDILVAVVDGLRGFPEAIEAVFPDTVVQTCIVHLLRNSLAFVSWKERRGVARALKAIYKAPNAQAAEHALDDFENSDTGKRFPTIAPMWRRQWAAVVPFFAFSQEVRKVVYTTNAIESLNSRVRKAIKARGHFPSEDAAVKAIFLVLREVEAKWRQPPPEWRAVKLQFAIQFGDRFPVAGS